MSAPPGRPCLTALNSPFVGRRFLLAGPLSFIGRAAECQVQLDLVSVSRQHACVEEAGGRFFLRDMGSRNGVKHQGRLVERAELAPGDIITVGEVDLRFEMPEVVAPSAPSAEGRALTGMDIIAASQARAGLGPSAPFPPASAPDGAPETQAPAARRGQSLKLTVAVILGFVIAGLVGFWVVKGGAKDEEQSVRSLAPVLVRVDGIRLVPLPADFRDTGISVDEESVVEARRYDTGILLVAGKSGGEATVAVRGVDGRRRTCRVLVRGRAPDPAAELRTADLTPAERRQEGERFLQRGRMLEAGEPYLALQEYRKAMAVMDPLPQKGDAYLEADRRAKAVEARIERRWNELNAAIKNAWKNSDLRRTEETMSEVMDLIPDENDPRNQVVQLYRRQLLVKVLSERKRR